MLAKNYTHNPAIAAIHKARVNVKSLAAESRIIRQEELRAGPAYRDELNLHRRGRLREESRYAHLSLALLRGRKYSTTERTEKPVDVKRLLEKVKRCLNTVTGSSVDRWLAE